MKRVAIIGTQGLPARYGGFETLVENIIGSGAQYTVFCSSADCPERLSHYRGAALRYVPLHANGIQSIPYDILSMLGALRGFDTLLILGTSGCLFLPLLRLLTRAKIVVNIDGLEHRRAKWGRLARLILRLSEASAVRWAHEVVSDNRAIADYVEERYGRTSHVVAYGGDHVLRPVSNELQASVLRRYGVEEGRFAFGVCRIEPENNCHVICEAFAAQQTTPLVMVGNWNVSAYSRELRKRFEGHPMLHLADPEYDLDTLCCLRRAARIYVHGHSAGGTNPSLVEAMQFGRPILAFDVSYNRHTTFSHASFWQTADDLLRLIQDPDPVCPSGAEHYAWARIAEQYEALY